MESFTMFPCRPNELPEDALARAKEVTSVPKDAVVFLNAPNQPPPSNFAYVGKITVSLGNSLPYIFVAYPVGVKKF